MKRCGALLILFLTLANTDVFLTNFTDSHLTFLHSVKKATVQDFANVLRKRLDYFKNGDNTQVELVILIDGSSSVGEANFQNELRFVRKLAADFVIGHKHARFAVLVFSTDVITHVNQLNSTKDIEKCTLLHLELPRIFYPGGNTFTLGALQEASLIFKSARPNAKKVLFLITDGFSNNGDPVPVAADLKIFGVKIFSFGIKSGNIEELYRISSPPSEEHAFFLESFSEFESLARRALHQDLGVGPYTPVSDLKLCSSLCEKDYCCNDNSTCSCGSLSGHFSCLCPAGYYGSGLAGENCLPCRKGTYSDGTIPGDDQVCKACPGQNSVTKKFPATSIDDCVCEDGFVPVGDTCEVITCPKLAPPKNGYFVKENCSNVLNAACGARCRIGYEMSGSSVRICQKNQTWTGEQPVCVPKKCSPLKPFDFGEVHCTNEGFEMLVEFGVDGVKKREIFKKKIGSVLHDGLLVDTECKFGCPVGFSLIGSKMRTCLPIMRWDGLQATCKPITCPSISKIVHAEILPFNCTQRGLRHKYGSKCSIQCKNGFILKGNSTRFCTGKHGTWSGKGQTYKCVDVEPPIFDCPSDRLVAVDSTRATATVDIDLPQAQDNSGVESILWVEPHLEANSSLPIGKHMFQIHGKDASGNLAKCLFWITIKDDEVPQMKNCISPVSMNFSTLISLDWEEPSFFDNSGNVTVIKHQDVSPHSGHISINYTGLDPSHNAASCIINITITDLTCLNPPIFPKSELKCSSNESFQICHIVCKDGFESLRDENVRISCEDGLWDDVEIIKELSMCSELVRFKEVYREGEIIISSEEICASKENVKEMENQISAILADETVGLDLECREQEELTNLLSKRKRSVKTKMRRKLYYKVYDTGSNAEIFQLTTKLSNIQNHSFEVKGRAVEVVGNYLSDVIITCNDGSVLSRKLCVKCPSGTFFNVSTRSCSACLVGSYQDKEGSLTCKKCPPQFTTLAIGRTTEKNCKVICSKGTYGNRMNSFGEAVEPCFPCPNGMFQPLDGKSYCIHEWKKEKCTGDFCKNNGSCISRGNKNFCSCVEGFFGPFCDKYFEPCESSPCINGGLCRSFSLRNFTCLCENGFFGEFCEYEKDFCSGQPCFNGGECTNTHEGFKCDCVDGFQGETCLDFIDTCALIEPCQNNATCQNTMKNFFCNCGPSFFGRFCENSFDYSPQENQLCCLESGELNQIELRLGQSVQKRIIEDQWTIFNFPKCSLTNYMIAEMNFPEFWEISACIWIETADQFNFGTLFSYATKESDNSFSLTDYNGIVLYLRGKRFVTDIVVNDGFWHFICTTWQNRTWKIFLDGKVQTSGETEMGGPLSGKGTLVLGQEQDFLGGGFNEVESFVGKMTNFMLFNRSLSNEEIFNLSSNCLTQKIEGELEIWRSLYENVRGSIEIENSTFCRSCGDPPSIFRANVVLEGDTALYQCHDGFLIQFPDEAKYSSKSSWTRKCLISGSWEPITPICARVNCGSPGILPHGKILGRSYEYEDSVKYRCNEGFQLVGPRRRTCLANGTWDEEKPRCLENSVKHFCPDLAAPRRGALFILSLKLTTNYVPGDRAEFMCDKGYNLSGPSHLTCLHGGMWDHNPPECL